MKLELYKKDTCPYCRRVFEYLDSVGRKDIVFKDVIHDQSAADELVKTGGKLQVPCLFIDGEPMYESLDIIQWLKDHPAQ